MVKKDLYELLEISPYSSREEVKDALTSYIKTPGVKSTKKFRQIGEELNLFLLLGQDLYNFNIDKFTKENDELISIVNNNSLRFSPATRKNRKIGEFSLEVEESVKEHRKRKTVKHFPKLTKEQKKAIIIGGVIIGVVVLSPLLFSGCSKTIDQSYTSIIGTYADKEDIVVIEDFDRNRK